ncbi:hypothetical protein IIC38_15615, partial [candidate division KSB1 bacterium]|nr:hypothetical protein [candidate division KSB1 bacterium]
MKISDFNKNGFLSHEIESWTKDQNFSNDEFYNLCNRINQFAQDTLYKLNVHNEDLQELLLATLYVRVLGIYQGAIILITKGMIVETKILARSILEILFRIGAISKSIDIAIDFIRQDHINQKKNINKLNMLSDGIKSSLDLSSLSGKYNEISNEIEEIDIKTHGIQWYADKAGLLDDYNTAYSSFCDAVHSNVRGLESYLVLDKNNKVISFSFGPLANEKYELFMTVS